MRSISYHSPFLLCLSMVIIIMMSSQGRGVVYAAGRRSVPPSVAFRKRFSSKVGPHQQQANNNNNNNNNNKKWSSTGVTGLDRLNEEYDDHNNINIDHNKDKITETKLVSMNQKKQKSTKSQQARSRIPYGSGCFAEL